MRLCKGMVKIVLLPKINHAVKLSALCGGLALQPERSSGTDFYYRLSNPQGHRVIVRLEGSGELEELNDLTGTCAQLEEKRLNRVSYNLLPASRLC
jgi:hypothetical protein